ncbi:MAG: radical SAM protein, partial [Candidatus Nanoarchaeia archaeon]|nr:radical SAM protein [Candidatus Nanoarchaeia archaeon]
MAATPRFLFVELTRRCPLQCLHCYYWRRGDSPLRMPQQRLEELLEEYAELAPGAAVVICGGEAMTDP